MAYTYQQHIDGTWLPAQSGETWNVQNPATEETIRTVPFGDGTDCRLALTAAAGAFPAWSRRTAYERAAILKSAADIMRARLDDLANTTTLESGKPLLQSRGEWSVAADLFEWFAEEGKRAYGRVIPSRNPARRLVVTRHPLGVVGVITAWNFPVYNIARAAAAALAAGCTVVIRPSEYTPLTAMELVNILLEAGMPTGVVNLINGDPSAMAQEMLDNPLCAKIHFTGSQRVGKLLMDGASRTVTRLSLELGGNAPVLIFPDVDVATVAAGAVSAKFRNAGQICVSPQRFFVHEAIAESFCSEVLMLTAKLRVGPGLDAATNVGPLISARQREGVEALVGAAIAAGATVATGAQRPTDQTRGFFYQPTVLTGLTPASPLFTAEVFGPVLPIASFSDTDTVIEQANSTRYGLAAYAWTNDLGTAQRVAERLEFGMVGINDWAPQATEAPFPGWKESGIGQESGPEGLAEYLETKVVSTGIRI
jgi:acyl-CoA reductase-like NAD-dependent aldehyde dehydrogenase